MYFLCVFFFFKQKTAYEMLLCDWSSDVCSSDLRDCEYVSERVLARANRRDNSLGVFRILDCLESLLRNVKDRVRLYCRHWRAGLAKHVNNFNSATLCFFQQDRSFDRKQPIARETSMLYSFS